jgi:hypothetical protein
MWCLRQNQTLQAQHCNVEFGLCKTQTLRFATVPDAVEASEGTEEQPPVDGQPVQEEIQAQHDIPRRSARLEDRRSQNAPQLQPELQQDNDAVSDFSDESDDPLLLQPYGNICAMLAHAGNINATPQSYREATHSSECVMWPCHIDNHHCCTKNHGQAYMYQESSFWIGR